VLERGLESGDLLARVREPRLVVPKCFLAARHGPVEFLRAQFELLASAVAPDTSSFSAASASSSTARRGGQVAELAHP